MAYIKSGKNILGYLRGEKLFPKNNPETQEEHEEEKMRKSVRKWEIQKQLKV